MRISIMILGICLNAGIAMAAPPNFSFSNQGKLVKSVPLSEMLKSHPTVRIEVQDPNEKKLIAFEAIPFEPVLLEALGKDWETAEEVVLTCSDGYQPSIPRSVFSLFKPYLAVSREGDPSFTLTNELEGAKKVSLAPTYLVWVPRRKGGSENQVPSYWPYQVVGMDLVKFEKKFPSISPPQGASAAALRGFGVFRERCLSCHSMNGEGGKVGPELNSPTSVTEMFYPPFLRRWLDDPASLRQPTTMPGLPKDYPNRSQAIDEVIAYLTAMKGKKARP